MIEAANPVALLAAAIAHFSLAAVIRIRLATMGKASAMVSSTSTSLDKDGSVRMTLSTL